MYEDEEQDFGVIEGTDEDGNKVLLQVLDYFFYNGEEYAILTDAEDADDCECDACAPHEHHNTDREYEYCLENGVLTIAVIRGKRRRKTAHTLMMQDMEVIAPNWHEAVAKYRKNGGTEKLKKFDYTSYDDNIPYYTMIVYVNKEKIKLLLDLNDSMLEAVKRVYPQKVYMR